MINVTKSYLPNKDKYKKYIDEIYENGWLTVITNCSNNYGPKQHYDKLSLYLYNDQVHTTNLLYSFHHHKLELDFLLKHFL